MSESTPNPDARTVLFVDDEAQMRKWFALTYVHDFDIVTAASVAEAIQILRTESDKIALIVTDFRMPQQDGLVLLDHAAKHHSWVVCILASAYADKDTVISAINNGYVFKVIEKPWTNDKLKLLMTQGLALYKTKTQERALHEHRAISMRETLGLLAHELNTPMASLAIYLQLFKDQLEMNPSLTSANEDGAWVHTTGQSFNPKMTVDAALRNLRYCQNIVQTFVQSARLAFPQAKSPIVPMSELVATLLKNFPLKGEERNWIKVDARDDFLVTEQRDLVYLCLCSLLQNALKILAKSPRQEVLITLGRPQQSKSMHQHHWIRFSDTGTGIPQSIYQNLMKRPVSKSADQMGTGMGLLFCKRVMHSLGGNIGIETKHQDGGFSANKTGTDITLYLNTNSRSTEEV